MWLLNEFLENLHKELPERLERVFKGIHKATSRGIHGAHSEKNVYEGNFEGILEGIDRKFY